MKPLITGLALMLTAVSASATVYTGAGYTVSIDNPGWSFDGTTLVKYYGLTGTAQPDPLQQLDQFSLSVTPDTGRFVSQGIISISGFVSGTPNSPEATGYVGLSVGAAEVTGFNASYTYVFGENPDWGPGFDFAESNFWPLGLPTDLSFNVTALVGGADSTIEFRLDTVAFQFVTAPIPEPSSYSLLALGLLCIAASAHKRKDIQ